MTFSTFRIFITLNNKTKPRTPGPTDTPLPWSRAASPNPGRPLVCLLPLRAVHIQSHTACGLLYPASWRNVFGVHSHWSTYHYLAPSHGWIPSVGRPFIGWWVSGSFAAMNMGV